MAYKQIVRFSKPKNDQDPKTILNHLGNISCQIKYFLTLATNAYDNSNMFPKEKKKIFSISSRWLHRLLSFELSVIFENRWEGMGFFKHWCFSERFFDLCCSKCSLASFSTLAKVRMAKKLPFSNMKMFYHLKSL